MSTVCRQEDTPLSPVWRYEAVNTLRGRNAPTEWELSVLDTTARGLYNVLSNAIPTVMTARKKEWYEDIHRAFSLYSRTNSFGGARWLIEAYLLTGASDEQIAAEFKTAPRVIQLFHDLFFDVRGYLDSPSLVHERVMATALQADQRRVQTTYIWKAIAYRFGYKAAREYISSGHYKGVSDEVHAWLEGMTEHAIVATAAAVSRNPTFYKEEGGCTVVVKVADKIAAKKAASGLNSGNTEGDSLFDTYTAAFLSTENERMGMFRASFDATECRPALADTAQGDVLAVDTER